MQTEFENVKVVAKANVYYDGKVLSHAFFMPDGSRKTLGILFPGEYEFGTGDAEIMEPTAGKLTVMLPGSDRLRPRHVVPHPRQQQVQVQVQRTVGVRLLLHQGIGTCAGLGPYLVASASPSSSRVTMSSQS